MSARDGGPAFPETRYGGHSNRHPVDELPGMTLRDYFMGQAVANAAICTGNAPEYELKNWFGGRGGITRYEIVAKQASEYADAMILVRPK